MPDEKHIDAPPDGLAGWRKVWAEDRRYPPTGGLVRRIARRLFLLLSGASGEARRQREFNLATLELLENLRGDFLAIRDVIMANLEGVNADLSRDIRDVDARIHKGIARNDALVSAVDRKIEGLTARIRDLANPLVGPGAPSPAFRSDFHYRRLEDALRGSEAEVRDAARHYMRYARQAAPVIDVGCGRGELLELCLAENIVATGFDSNERAVADLRKRGLDARIGFVPGCFEGVGSRSVGTIVAMHVVEHLPFPELYGLLVESLRVLRPGGYLAIETPNARSLVASASEFWKDPTHLGPRHEAALVTLAREIGFDVEELNTTAPFSEDDQLRVSSHASADVVELAQNLNRLLYGDQNLRLVLRARRTE